MTTYDEFGLTYDESELTYDGGSPSPLVDLAAFSPPDVLPRTSWRWEVWAPSGTFVPWYPTVGGSLNFDQGRDIPRAVSGLSSIAAESVKVVTLKHRMRLYLVKEGQDDVLMGTFYLSENTIQLHAYVADGAVQSINHLGLADSFLLLRRSTGAAETIFAGSDPAQEMQRLLDEAGIPNSIAGSVYSIASDITWDGAETLLNKISQLAELAGHLPPWADPTGIVRSETLDFAEQTVYPLEQLGPEATTISAVQNFLTAPNRVIVTGTEGTVGYPLRGQWDAPSIYLFSEFQRGYVLTETVDVQGLQSNAHAEEVARLIGMRNAASSLTFSIPPTDALNEPRLISYLGHLWRVDSWDVGLATNSRMTVQATLYVPREET